MRCRGLPAWRQGWLPSKPPSHASLKKAYEREPGYPWTCGDGPRRHGTGERDLRRRRVRGDRARPSDELDPRGIRRLPNRERFGRRRQASGRGRGVRRHLAVSDPGPMSVSRRPLAGSTALTEAAVCSF